MDEKRRQKQFKVEATKAFAEAPALGSREGMARLFFHDMAKRVAF